MASIQIVVTFQLVIVLNLGCPDSSHLILELVYLVGGFSDYSSNLITVVNYFIAKKKEANCNRKFACCSLHQLNPLYMSVLQALNSRTFFSPAFLVNGHVVILIKVTKVNGDWMADCFSFAWEILVFCG